MNELLVDTSVWINYLNGIASRQTDLLAQSIEQNRIIHTTPTIVQEVLQGVREDDHYTKVKNSLSGFHVLDWDPVQAAIQAADIYRSLRKSGITIRRANDCLIAAFAIHFSIPLLHDDRDFERIGMYFPLQGFE